MAEVELVDAGSRAGSCGSIYSLKRVVMRSREHWEGVYERKPPEQVSWYRPHLEQSLRFIEAAGLGPDAAIIDVGGGASTLVDDLLERGRSNISRTPRAIQAAADAGSSRRVRSMAFPFASSSIRGLVAEAAAGVLESIRGPRRSCFP